jgi:hypothetical protein
MTDNKKAAGCGDTLAASKSVYACHSNLIRCKLKVVIYQLAPSTAWMQKIERCREQAPRLFLLGALHG